MTRQQETTRMSSLGCFVYEDGLLLFLSNLFVHGNSWIHHSSVIQPVVLYSVLLFCLETLVPSRILCFRLVSSSSLCAQYRRFISFFCFCWCLSRHSCVLVDLPVCFAPLFGISSTQIETKFQAQESKTRRGSLLSKGRKIGWLSACLLRYSIVRSQSV